MELIYSRLYFPFSYCLTKVILAFSSRNKYFQMSGVKRLEEKKGQYYQSLSLRLSLISASLCFATLFRLSTARIYYWGVIKREIHVCTCWFWVPRELNVASSVCRSWCLGSIQWNTLASGLYTQKWEHFGDWVMVVWTW